MLEPISTISWNRNCCNRTQGCTGDRRRRQEAGLICVRHQLIYINVYTVNAYTVYIIHWISLNYVTVNSYMERNKYKQMLVFQLILIYYCCTCFLL